MTDIPKSLLKEIKTLEEMFAVDTAKLKEITSHFVGELERGLTGEGGDIVRKSPSSRATSALHRNMKTDANLHDPSP